MKIEINFSEEELKNEKWVPIPYYENDYEASTLGRIRTHENKTTYTERHGIRHWQQRILKPKYCLATSSKAGSNRKIRYDARIELWKDGKHKTYLAARLILASFDKRFDLYSKMTVNHIDDNPLNNRVSNLEWCSRKENLQKGFETGAYPYSKIKIIDKRNNEEIIFTSMSKASKFLKQNSGYLSEKFSKGIFENLNYKWEKIN